jgi:hypothetical protein
MTAIATGYRRAAVTRAAASSATAGTGRAGRRSSLRSRCRRRRSPPAPARAGMYRLLCFNHWQKGPQQSSQRGHQPNLRQASSSFRLTHAVGADNSVCTDIVALECASICVAQDHSVAPSPSKSPIPTRQYGKYRCSCAPMSISSRSRTRQ